MVKPVVFIPGLPASELWHVVPSERIFPPSLGTLLSAKKRAELVAELCDIASTNIVAGQPIRKIMEIAKQAESLYDILRSRFSYTIESGDNFRAVGWDWRLSTDHSKVQADIRSAIAELKTKTGQNVVIILHSTGGLVFRRLIDSDPALAASIESIISFGVPWAGTLTALFNLTDGESIGFLGAKLTAAQTRKALRCSQAAYDLCPPDPAQTDFTTPSGEPFTLVQNGNKQPIAPLTTTSWMSGDADVEAKAAIAHASLGARSAVFAHAIPVVNIAGWGIETNTLCTITSTSVKYAATLEGDGTVPFASASWLRGPSVRSLSVPIGATAINHIPDPHSQIWDNDAVMQVLNEALNDQPAGPFVYAAVDNDTALDTSMPVLVRISASNADGTPLAGATAALSFEPGSHPHPINGTRLNLVFDRASSMKANVGTTQYRFRADVKWNGGSKEIPLLIEV